MNNTKDVLNFLYTFAKCLDKCIEHENFLFGISIDSLLDFGFFRDTW